MLERRLLPAILLFVVVVSGCSKFVSKPRGYHEGPNVVLILVDPSDFKERIAQGITDYVTVAGYDTEVDTTSRAKHYKSIDFAAVIYMAEYWAWHTPFHTKQYNRHNSDASNIIFLITSGDPDVSIKAPFDAVTTASDPDREDVVLREIYSRLDTIIEN